MKTHNLLVTELQDTMEPKLRSFLFPLCHARENANILEKVGTNPLFDRNVIRLVAQFAVGYLTLFFSYLTFVCSKI